MSTSREHLNNLSEAYDEEFPFFDENILMLDWYASRLLRTVRERKLKTLLSLGIGYETVTSQLVAAVQCGDLTRYSIVEGSDEIIGAFLPKIPAGLPIDVTQSLFEAYRPEGRFDAIEMGFVLEHVDDPSEVVRRFREFLNPGGVLFVAVPNARSLHRLIGHAANLLTNVYSLSDADQRLGHKRYFDESSLCQLLIDCGLRIGRREGIFLKPMTTAQLRALGLTPGVWQALCQVGVDFPDIANSIYVEAMTA